MSNQEKYVLYHANCADGFAAAYAAWKHLGDEAEYIPVSYGEEPPELPEDSRVYIVDFSYPRAILEKMAGRYKLLVLDHHKTAQAELEDLPYARFDMNRSDAIMAWQWFHPYEEVPKLLLYVQDRDLWRWELLYSKEINAAIASYSKDFEQWNQLVNARAVEGLAYEGKVILRAQKRVVEMQCKEAYLHEIADYEVPVVNATAYVSEVGHELLEQFPDALFSASYRDVKDGREWSLRSRGDFDVSEIAKRFGGGGHAAAAGFRE